MTDPQQVLGLALGLLREKGSCRGTMAVDSGDEPTSVFNDPVVEGYSAGGAIARAAWSLKADDHAIDEARRRIMDMSGSPSMSIDVWNDIYASDDEILQTFEVAAGQFTIPDFPPDFMQA